MPSLQFWQHKLLIRDGKLALDPRCCCCKCSDADVQVLTSFTTHAGQDANGNPVPDCHDLGQFFAKGRLGKGKTCLHWRLIEVGYCVTYCSGNVDADGTLVCVGCTNNGGTTTGLDCVTHTFCSLYPYDGHLQLQIGCNGKWPGACP